MQRFQIIKWTILFIIFGSTEIYSLTKLPESISGVLALGITLTIMIILAMVDLHPKLRKWNNRGREKNENK